MTPGLTIDPAIHTALRAALALLFAWAAFHKLRDVGSFREALANYELLPAGLTTAAATLAIVAELSIAFALPLSPGRAPALGAAALLVIYTAAVAINLARGRDIDCACAGPAQHRPLSAPLIGRNAVLIVIALIAALPSTSRLLVWMDAVTILGAVAFLCALYGTMDEISANGPKLAALRGLSSRED